eukprot:gene13675-29074_t
MVLSAWYMDDDVTADQRLPHKTEPEQIISKDMLAELGVLAWEGLNGNDDDPTLLQICKDRGYSYTDVVHCCPDKLPEYETKILSFYQEHIHYDEEIRYCMDGSGYFDVRDKEDRWIRVSLQKGDLIILPEGIYHRYTNDTNNYIKAMRLFVGEPVWTPYNRQDIDEENPSRTKYSTAFLAERASKKLKTEAENLIPVEAAE